MNKRRLGRGLESLLGREEGGFEPGSFDSSDFSYIPVDRVDPNPFQPRRNFDPAEISALRRLAPSARHAPAGPGALGQ